MALRDKHDVSKADMDALAEAAMGPGLKAVRAFLAYEGSDQRYAAKSKAGIGLIGAYSRFYSSQTNRAAIEMQAEREGSKMLPAERPKAMSAGRRSN